MSSKTRKFAVVNVFGVLTARMSSEPAKMKEMMEWLSGCKVNPSQLKQWMVLIQANVLRQCPEGFWSAETERKIKEYGWQPTLAELVAKFGSEIELSRFPEDWILNQKQPTVAAEELQQQLA